MSLTPLKELMVMGALRAHPLHGYALVDALDGGLGWTVGLTRPTVYGILRRFVERGWIDGEVVRDSRFPEREVYQVTAEGETAYHVLLARCVEDHAEGNHPVAALLAHLGDLDDEARRHAVEVLLEQRLRRLEALETFPDHEGTAGAALALLTEQVRAEVNVLRGLLE